MLGLSGCGAMIGPASATLTSPAASFGASPLVASGPPPSGFVLVLPQQTTTTTHPMCRMHPEYMLRNACRVVSWRCLVYVRARMHSRRFILGLGSSWLVLACAVGVDSSDTTPTDDDAAAPLGHDAGTHLDSGVITPGFDAGAGADVTLPPPPPPPPDAGSSCKASTGTLVTYDFTGQPGNQTSTSATSSMAGITATAIDRASTVTAVSGANSINGSNWSTGALDTTRYFSFTLTPPASCTLDITSIAIDTKTSSSGPSSASVATSADAFASHATFSLNTSANATLSVSGSTKAVEIRVYGYNASGTSGTARIQNTLTATGALK